MDKILNNPVNKQATKNITTGKGDDQRCSTWYLYLYSSTILKYLYLYLYLWP